MRVTRRIRSYSQHSRNHWAYPCPPLRVTRPSANVGGTSILGSLYSPLRAHRTFTLNIAGIAMFSVILTSDLDGARFARTLWRRSARRDLVHGFTKKRSLRITFRTHPVFLQGFLVPVNIKFASLFFDCSWSLASASISEREKGGTD